MWLGVASLGAQGRLEEAIFALQQGGRTLKGGGQQSQAAEAQYHLGVALKRLGGRGAEAAAAFRSCLAVTPDHAEASHLLGALGSTAHGDTPPCHTGNSRRMIRSAWNLWYNHRLLVPIQYTEWLILNDRVQSSFIAGVTIHPVYIRRTYLTGRCVRAKSHLPVIPSLQAQHCVYT